MRRYMRKIMILWVVAGVAGLSVQLRGAERTAAAAGDSRAPVAKGKPSEQYFKDRPVVEDAQAQLLEKIRMMKESSDDPRIAALIENVEKEMQKALDHLAKATNSPKTLPEALAAEQAAYQ